MAGIAALPASVTAATSGQRDTVENTSIVSADGTGNYLSLKDAFTALSGSFTGSPNHTLYIASDLQETQPLVLNRNSGFNSTLTIKPLGGPRTVTVTSPAAATYTQDLVGISWNRGNFSSETPLCNALIDGTIGGAEHGLKFVFNHDEQTTSLYTPHHGFLIGSNCAVEIRNCHIVHNPVTETQSYAIYIQTRVQRPITLTGNLVEAMAQQASGIISEVTNEGINPVAADILISNNVINAARHGISVYQRDATVENNTIHITGYPDEIESLVGVVISRHASVSTTTLVRNNKVVITGADSSQLVQGIRNTSGLDHAGNLLVHNNMVSLNLNTGVESRAVCGITNVYRRAAVSEVAHNSIFMPGNQSNNEEINRNFHALGVDSNSSNSITVANNMLRVGSKWASGLYFHTGNDIESDGNVVGISGDAVAVTTDQTTYTLLADWKTASGLDTESQAFDPLASWASPEDLHLVHSVAGLEPGVVGVLQAPLATDIDGDPRSLTIPAPGADEVDFAASVGEWSVY